MEALFCQGVIKVDGSFEKGDLIEIFSHNGIKIASGLTSYNSQEIITIAGKKTYDIETLLGYMEIVVNFCFEIKKIFLTNFYILPIIIVF